MPRVAKPLSEKEIKNTKPNDKAYTLADGKGLHLLVTPDGRKAWEFIYLSPKLHKRRKTSVKRTLKLGIYFCKYSPILGFYERFI